VRPGAVRTKFWQKVPFRIPGNALAPEQVAEKIIAAVGASQQGTLDL
jgi:short-subunit dehydrogenase